MKLFKRKITIILGSVLVVALVFYGGFEIGSEQIDQPKQEKEGPVISVSSQPSQFNADFSLFWEAMNIIKNKHFKVDKVSDKDLLYGAIKGTVGALDDPYSTFFNPEDAEKFEEDISGKFGGIGAEIGKRDDQLVVVAPLKGNPAEKEGLKSGDKILKVDDTFTSNLSLIEAVKVIRGEPGTKVTLLIMRENWDSPKEFDITRQIIKVPTLEWEMKEDIAYIQLFSFNTNAPSVFHNASVKALLNGPKGVILDLRNNSGGFLEVANRLAGWFIKRGKTIVQEKFPSGKTNKLTSTGNGVWGTMPVVVLVNGGSASASEILAGALRDHLEATLVGTKTFGKGTVQEIQNLSGGSKIKISIAEWLTPSGEAINDKGLEPDVKVELTEEDVENEQDPQLEKAVEIIRQKANQKNMESIPTIVF